MKQDARSAADRVLEGLRLRIIKEGMQGAERHLNQSRLAEEFGVSRIPIRDALLTLAGEGLVELHPGSRASVTEMSCDDLQELYELREAIEPMIGRLATLRAHRAAVLLMERQLRIMEEAYDHDQWLEANTEFHSLLYAQAERPKALRMIRMLDRQAFRYVRLHISEIGTHRLAREHQDILDAVRIGDSGAVEETTRRHLENTHEVLLRFMLDMDAPR